MTLIEHHTCYHCTLWSFCVNVPLSQHMANMKQEIKPTACLSCAVKKNNAQCQYIIKIKKEIQADRCTTYVSFHLTTTEMSSESSTQI